MDLALSYSWVGLVAGVLTILSSVVYFIGLLRKSSNMTLRWLLGSACLVILFLGIYGIYITSSFMKFKATVDVRMELNSVSSELRTAILPSFSRLMQDTILTEAHGHALAELLERTVKLRQRTEAIPIKLIGSVKWMMDIYKHNHLAYLDVLVASIEYRRRHLTQAQSYSDYVLRDTENVLEAIKKVKEERQEGGDGKIIKIINWINGDEIANRMYYMKAWSLAVRMLCGDDQTKVGHFVDEIHRIDPSSYLDKYPLTQNIIIKEFIEEYEDEFPTDFLDTFVSHIGSDDRFDTSIRQDDTRSQTTVGP